MGIGFPPQSAYGAMQPMYAFFHLFAMMLQDVAFIDSEQLYYDNGMLIAMRFFLFLLGLYLKLTVASLHFITPLIKKFGGAC